MQLITKSEYARRRGCTPANISQLIRKGKLPVIDGKIDPIAADVALEATRERAPKVSQNQRPRRSLQRTAADPNVRRCHGCGGVYRMDIADTEASSPDPRRFCSDDCGTDVRNGKNRKEIHARIRTERRNGGWTEQEIAAEGSRIFDWVGPELKGPCYCTVEEFRHATEM